MLMPIRRPDDIGSIIRARRRALGWDQATLASRLGVSRLWVSQIENGKPKAQLDLVLRCLNELQTPLWAGPAQATPSSLAEEAVPILQAPPRPVIDINAIADMGLTPPAQKPARK